MEILQEPAREAPTPPETGLGLVEQKIRASLDALTDATRAVLDTTDPARFARAGMLCKHAQTIAVELVKSVRQSAQIRACGPADMAMGGYLGAEAQYVAQAHMGANYFGLDDGAGGIYMPPARPNDQVALQRDLMMTLQSWFEEQKKQNAESKKPAPLTRYDHYLELNEALSARDKLAHSMPDSPLLAKINSDIERLVDVVAQGKSNDDKPADVVPAELLRGHPPGARLEPGDPFDPRGPVLHREGGDEDLDRRGAPDRHHEEAVGH